MAHQGRNRFGWDADVAPSTSNRRLIEENSPGRNNWRNDRLIGSFRDPEASNPNIGGMICPDCIEAARMEASLTTFAIPDCVQIRSVRCDGTPPLPEDADEASRMKFPLQAAFSFSSLSFRESAHKFGEIKGPDVAEGRLYSVAVAVCGRGACWSELLYEYCVHLGSR